MERTRQLAEVPVQSQGSRQSRPVRLTQSVKLLRWRSGHADSSQTYNLPPRRARLPEDLEAPKSPQSPAAALHSPFSPLSPSCRLYPDGILEPRWLQKHLDLVPSVFLCFYSLTSDPTLATLHDNKIKTDIGTLRNAIAQSGYKSRVCVVIIPDQPTPSTEGVQERLENIRRGSGLETKSFFSVPSQGSQEELERIADNMLATVYAQAVEYYRDLGRHARRKRGRGFAPQPSVPPTSGTSQTLSLPGWTVRYDFKSGIFAGFRDEMDNALRSFELAYETLLGPDVLDAIPSWSPRWNEARLLADMIAIRGLRCLLWNGQTSAAVRRWQAHRDRMCDFVDRRGRGTNNYGWKAWEARWTMVMANLIESVGLPDFAPASGALFLQPEKGVIGERLPPWELLHHTGYWYRSAARHLSSRRALAHSIPEDDRRPPNFSPASKVASRAFAYDNYMCPEPHEEYPLDGRDGVDHSKMIVECLSAAQVEFEKRKQPRLAAEVALECAREFAASKHWQSAMDLLLPLWENTAFRFEGWTQIIEDLGWTLRAAAQHLGRSDIVLSIDWRLLDRGYTRQPNWHYDIGRALEGIPADGEEPLLVKIASKSVPSFLSASFAFQSDEGKAGQTCRAQLTLGSNAFPGSAPITLEKIMIQFEGSIKPLILHHDGSSAHEGETPGGVFLSTVLLQEQSAQDATSVWQGDASLILRPGATTVFEMAVHLRELGDARVSTVELTLLCDDFALHQAIAFPTPNHEVHWFLSPTSKKRVFRTHPHSIHVLPRPPKLEIKALNLLSQYYTNEPVELQFSILNAEDSDANVKLDVVMTGREPQGFKLLVAGEEIDTAAARTEESSLLSVAIGTIGAAKSIATTIQVDAARLPISYDFTLRAAYSLVSDPATPIVQSAAFKLNLVNPFEANYDLLPRLHRAPWPSLFDYDEALDSSTTEGGTPLPHGLSQAWCLVTRYASFASEDLKITDLSIAVQPTSATLGISCATKRRSALPSGGLQIKPQTIDEAQFDLDVQKASLDGRGPASLDVSFIIKWQRVNGAAPAAENSTILPVPRLSIFGIEPRVLASVSFSRDALPLIFLDIAIENASNHFLTFGLAMEPSDEFAFSGAKQITVHVLPMSRRFVTYRLLPLVRGAWIKPGLVVRDKYFQKVLRIMPTEGLRLDKDGFMIWVPPAEEEDEAGSEE